MENAERQSRPPAPLIRRAEIVRILPQWLNPGEENWRWIALEDQDPQTRRVKIAPLNTGMAIVPTEIVGGNMVEGTGIVVPVKA